MRASPETFQNNNQTGAARLEEALITAPNSDYRSQINSQKCDTSRPTKPRVSTYNKLALLLGPGSGAEYCVELSVCLSVKLGKLVTALWLNSRTELEALNKEQPARKFSVC